jgi:L-arginine dehydrogenase
MDAPIVLDEAAVLARVNRADVPAALETAFAGLISTRSVQPAQTVTVFPDGLGDCIFYPGALLDLGLVGVKVSPYLQGLADAGKYPVTAYTMLLSASTGRPLLICDSYALTTIRTAATSVLALRYLAPSTARRLAVIGTGKLGREHLRFALDEREWDDVRVYSPSTAEDQEKQSAITAEFSATTLTFPKTAEAAVRDADVVMLCTSSGSPVIDGAWLGGSVLVTSISTNSPGAHEIDPAILPSLDVYCDYRATAPVTAGEMKIAIEAGSWSETLIVADLPELVTGAKPAESDRPRFFRSTGLGIEDLAIASLLVG